MKTFADYINEEAQLTDLELAQQKQDDEDKINYPSGVYISVKQLKKPLFQ